MKVHLAALAAASLLVPASAAAQAAEGMISAAEPQGMVEALSPAGYTVTSDVDSYGDPLIVADFHGYQGRIVFYGCEQASHEGCNSVQFTVGLDRAAPMRLEMVNELLASERFVSINLDDEGDPWLTWDVVTLDGIPARVFLHAMSQFAAQVAVVAEAVFADEETGS